MSCYLTQVQMFTSRAVLIPADWGSSPEDSAVCTLSVVISEHREPSFMIQVVCWSYFEKTLDIPVRCLPADIGLFSNIQLICDAEKTAARHY